MRNLSHLLLIFSILWISNGCNKKLAENKTDVNSKEVNKNITVLCSNETFVLNSVNKTTFGNGINRNSYTTKIPKRTKFIIVRVQVDNKDTEAKLNSSIELLKSLTDSGVDSNFKLAGGMSILALMPPTTGKYCDFFVLPDVDNFNGFTKVGEIGNWENDYKAIPKVYQKLNTQSFSLAVDIKDLKDKENLYLGFLNHSLTNACRIFLDVIAIK